MKHFICEVSPKQYTITYSDGTLKQTAFIQLIKFVDADGKEKAINPVHQIAWHQLNKIYET